MTTIRKNKRLVDDRQLELELEPKKKAPPRMFKFYCYHIKSHSYTTIGAENIHHACNKATKHTANGAWDGITKHGPKKRGWEFVTLAEFNKLLKKHSI